MAFPLERKIEAYSKAWAEETAIRLKASLELALKQGQPLRRGDQEASLNFNDKVRVGDGSVSVQILATADYWINIEDGRGAEETPPPSKAVGAKWQGKNGIKTQQILKEIQLNYKNKKYSRLTKTGKRLSKPKKELSFSEASKLLSCIFARSIGKKGIVPKPFVDRVINDQWLKVLTDQLTEITGQHFIGEMELNNEFKNIKIVI
jgi:hypothetical protein